jgi:cytochrome c-type biogenesis protein CcmE
MNKNRGMIKLLLAGGLALGCGVVGVVSLLGGSTAQAVAIRNVESHKDRIDVFGKLDQASIVPIQGANLVRFDILEEEQKGATQVLTGKRLTVLYDNKALGLPGNFPGASHARCTGTYDPVAKQFVADRVLTKCPSKYKEENVDLGTQTALEKWQKATGLKVPSAKGGDAKAGATMSEVKAGEAKAGEAKASSY